jgi:hypothetical protein
MKVSARADRSSRSLAVRSRALTVLRLPRSTGKAIGVKPKLRVWRSFSAGIGAGSCAPCREQFTSTSPTVAGRSDAPSLLWLAAARDLRRGARIRPELKAFRREAYGYR